MSSTTTSTECRRGGAVGAYIDFRDGHWIVPDHPIIPFNEGDGTGPPAGTSMASPAVAGVAALIIGKYGRIGALRAIQ